MFRETVTEGRSGEESPVWVPGPVWSGPRMMRFVQNRRGKITEDGRRQEGREKQRRVVSTVKVKV